MILFGRTVAAWPDRTHLVEVDDDDDDDDGIQETVPGFLAGFAEPDAVRGWSDGEVT